MDLLDRRNNPNVFDFGSNSFPKILDNISICLSDHSIFWCSSKVSVSPPSSLFLVLVSVSVSYNFNIESINGCTKSILPGEGGVDDVSSGSIIVVTTSHGCNC